MTPGHPGFLAMIQKDAPWVVRVEHDPRRHEVRLYDASGDWRAFPCSCFLGVEEPK